MGYRHMIPLFYVEVLEIQILYTTFCILLYVPSITVCLVFD